MLNNLTTKKNIRTFSVSPENLTGEKGKGGMATEGSASYAARELGQGWKVNPYLVSRPGETLVLADVKGQGAIKHIWITDSASAGRLLILRIYFDGHKNPAVEAPLSDFFCNADYREYRQLSSLAMCVNPKRGLNYIRLFIRKRIYSAELRMKIKCIRRKFFFLAINLIIYIADICPNIFNFYTKRFEIRHFEIAV